MYKVILGQDGDDYIADNCKTPTEAKTSAENYIEQIHQKKLKTYVYISISNGSKHWPPFNNF